MLEKRIAGKNKIKQVKTCSRFLVSEQIISFTHFRWDCGATCKFAWIVSISLLSISVPIVLTLTLLSESAIVPDHCHSDNNFCIYKH